MLFKAMARENAFSMSLGLRLPQQQARTAPRPSRWMMMIFIVCCCENLLPLFESANGARAGHAKVKPLVHKTKTPKTKVEISCVVFPTSEERSFMNYYWSAEEGEKKTY